MRSLCTEHPLNKFGFRAGEGEFHGTGLLKLSRITIVWIAMSTCSLCRDTLKRLLVRGVQPSQSPRWFLHGPTAYDIFTTQYDHMDSYNYYMLCSYNYMRAEKVIKVKELEK